MTEENAIYTGVNIAEDLLDGSKCMIFSH